MLPETGKISMLDVWRELNPPMDPKDCDYYFETRADFDARRDQIIKENNNDLSQKTFGFGDGVAYLSNAFVQTNITSTPKMIVARNATKFYYCFGLCNSLTTITEGLFDNCPNATEFSGCFIICTSLTTVPQDLFDNCTKVTSFSNCFGYCSNITSSLPDVWNKNKFPKVTSGDFYAFECTKAVNYNEILSNFGGPDTNPEVPLSIKQIEEPINNQSVITKSIERIIDNRLPDGPITLGDTNVRELAGINDGQISLNDLKGKQNVFLKLVLKSEVYQPKNYWCEYVKIYGDNNILLKNDVGFSFQYPESYEIVLETKSNIISNFEIKYYFDSRSDGYLKINCFAVDILGKEYQLFSSNNLRNSYSKKRIFLFGASENNDNNMLLINNFPLKL